MAQASRLRGAARVTSVIRASLFALVFATQVHAAEPFLAQPNPTEPKPNEPTVTEPPVPESTPLEPAVVDPAAPLDLLAGDHRKTWKAVVADDNEPAPDTWTRDDKVLFCGGKPAGYLRTIEKFENFILEFKWRYPDQEQGNSGVLLHLQEPDKVWPKSIQIQMMNAEAGRIFPLGGATAGDAKPQEQLVVDGRQWQHWQVESRGPLITLRIMKQGTWQVANSLQLKEPLAGHVGFQSEDSKVEFREILLTKLPAEKPAEKPVPPVPMETPGQP